MKRIFHPITKGRNFRAAWITAAVLALDLAATNAPAATKYFDATAGTGNGIGGSGTLTAQTTALYSNAATGDATLSAAAATDDGIFAGTAGTVTFGASYTLNSATFNVTGYTLTTSGSSTRIFTSPITLANNVTLNLAPIAAAALTLSGGAVAGGTSSAIQVGGATTATGDAIRINVASGATIAASTPINITTTGTLGIVGFVGNSGTGTINADITNNSSVTTMIGATATLIVNGSIKGSAPVQFSAGTSGGAGTINLNAANTYAGESHFNGTASGAVKLGVDDALPTGTNLILGYTSGNGQKLDLNGHNQTVASLASNTGGTGSITSSATGTGTDTLTINGAATTSFALAIADGTTRKVGLALATTNTGSLTLTAANTYTGPTSIGGGTLLLSTGSVGSASVQVTGSGALTLSNATALSDTSTLSLTGGTKLSLNAGSGTSETIGSLILDGTVEPVGTYTASQLSAFDPNITFTSSFGETLTVTTAVPEPTTLLAGALLAGAAGWRVRRRLSRRLSV